MFQFDTRFIKLFDTFNSFIGYFDIFDKIKFMVVPFNRSFVVNSCVHSSYYNHY